MNSKKKSENTKNCDEDTIDKENLFPIVGMGASAGGLEALEKFFVKMSPDTDIAFVIIMHFDPSAKSFMVDILKSYTKMEVFQVEDGIKIKPNHVYIIPPNKDMAILHRTLHLYEPVLSKGIRHPIDFFFRSLADDNKENAICIILSGTGTEGTLGLKAIKGEGGMVMVQSMESAAYDGMPRSAIATGLVDYILPPEKMPEQLEKYVNQFYNKKMIRPEKNLTEQISNYIQKIIILIRNHSGIDFSSYKQATLIRRIERRMSLLQIENISDYTYYLQENISEIQILYKEFLIGVTSFFRDPAAFRSLKEKILPEMLKDKKLDQPLRIWVPGCSTGEEAYSISIMLKEHMEDIKTNLQIQIFATDIDREAVEIGRSGIYPSNISIDVSLDRLNRFFIKNPDTYTIKKEIREMVIFAPQNAITDPPFLRLDMISCRNLLIYLVPEAQKKLLLLFHYALNRDGFLFLGSSESIGELEELFSIIDKKWKIFKRLGDVSRIPAMAYYQNPPWIEIKKDQTRTMANTSTKIEKMLLATYAPSCAIINDKGDIIYIHGRTGKYLEHTTGNFQSNIMDIAREGLRTELNIAIHRVLTTKKDVIFQNLNIKTDNDKIQTINLTVKPIKELTLQGLVMIIFEDIPTPEPSKIESFESDQAKDHITELETQLNTTKENLQSTIEELQTSNEELKSTNEELMSSNEELQSTNEELGASREELQSLNEELVTLGGEHQSKIEELSKTVTDLKNVIASTEIATLFLDADLKIKDYTPAIDKIFSLIKADIGRPIGNIVSNLENEDFIKDVNEVLKTLVLKEKEIKDNKGFWYLMRILPYRTDANILNGTITTFMDITGCKRSELIEQDIKAILESLTDTVHDSILILDKDMRVISANSSFYSTFQVSRDETENKLLYEIGNGLWNIQSLRKLFEDILSNDNVKNFEIDHVFSNVGRKVMSLNARRIYRNAEKTILAIEDISDSKKEI